MFGSRRDEDGTWRLCERRGRLILYPFTGLHEISISFADRESAEACAEELNAHWDRYSRDRVWTRGAETQWLFVSIIYKHGGIAQADLARIKAVMDALPWWKQRFMNTTEVPLFKFAVVPRDHPDLKVLEAAYQNAGLGLGIDHALSYGG